MSDGIIKLKNKYVKDIMPECVGRVNGTFCFPGASYRAQLIKGRLLLNLGFFFFLQKHFFG